MATKLKDGDTILFIGDSITDCGRRDQNRPYGGGYVSLVNDLLTIREPSKDITVINRGIGGNTVDDLRSRWHDDVIAHAPQWLSIKIGINDLNRHLSGNGVIDPTTFAEIYEGILAQTKAKLPKTKLLLIDPFFVSQDPRDDSYRGKVMRLLPKYAAVVARLATTYKARHLRTQALFQQQLRYRHPDRFGHEPVHPYTVGHLLIAEGAYAALS
jgi:lysophospholipase L1-like esterase